MQTKIIQNQKNTTNSHSPKIVGSPTLYPVKKSNLRLIDQGLSFYEASIAGNAERYTRGETSHTMHVWWARRPHSAMRALVFASLSKKHDAKSMNMLSELGANPVPSKDILDKVKSTFLKDYGSKPKVLDMFGGGGTIPFEASILGCDSYSIDVNELAVFLQKANLTFSALLDKKELKDLVKAHGSDILSRLAKKTDELFPLRKKVLDNGSRTIGYLWTYSMPCEECKYVFTLAKRPWLSKKKGKTTCIVNTVGNLEDEASIESVSDLKDANSRWGKRGVAICPKCGHEHKSINIKKCTDIPVAIITTTGKGKDFEVRKGACLPKSKLNKIEKELLSRTGLKIPNSSLPVWSGIVNPALYGMDSHADLFNQRQRIVTLMLIEELIAEYKELESKRGEGVAKFVVGALSGLIDQMVDWNCRLAVWISQNEQVGRAFCGPGIPMIWDYTEIDPTGTGPANLNSKLSRICAGVEALNLLENPVNVQQASAIALPFKDGEFNAIVTDPPYYDNIFYSVLADFFYAWKKPLIDLVLGNKEDSLVSNTASLGEDELVASSFRSGSQKAAHDDYCIKLEKAIAEATRVLAPDGLLSFVYSHASINGWAALVSAFRPSALYITSVQPLSIERKARPRAMGSEAVNTCVAFIARKYETSKPSISKDEILLEFSKVLKSGFHQSLLQSGWVEHDVGVALIANGVAILSNYSEVKEESTESIIKAMAGMVKGITPGFSVTNRGSL